MKNSEFLTTYPLQLSLLTKEKNAMIKVLKQANRDHVLIWEVEKGVRTTTGQYWDFKIHCPVTGFANSYFHLGIIYSEKVLPIWEKRF